jgi:hypothetical protein
MEKISEAIKSKGLLVFKDPWHDLKIERYLSGYGSNVLTVS